MPGTVIPFLIWLGVIIAAIVVSLQLSGCASAEEEVWHRICHEQPLGQDERGFIVVRHFCIREVPK